MIKAKRLSSTAIIILLFAPLSIMLYLAFILNPANADHPLLYALLLVGDFIGITVILSLWLTVLMDILIPEHHTQPLQNHQAKNFVDSYPTIDILITVAGEPIELITRTAVAARNLQYPHHTYILDDGKSPEVHKLCEKLGIGYVRRPFNHYAKAGNLNHGLQFTNSEFFAILDADQTPRSNFITTLLPYLADPRIAMVQAPQHFINQDNFIAAGSAQAQDIFYKYVCPARNLSNSVFCVGTNVIFRRIAIDHIGGIAQLSHSEDIWTSYQLHQKGWKTLFVNKILTDGLAPTDLISYSKQQLRWAQGGLSMIFSHNPFVVPNLSLDQRLQYFTSNFFYFSSITILLYCLFPILYLLFDIKPLQTDNGGRWLIHYLPYVTLYYYIGWLLTGRIHISSLAISFGTFYPYLRAIFSSALNTQHEWIATTAGGRRSTPLMAWIWPHVFLIMLTLASFVIGWYNPNDFWATTFYTVLACWNMYLLIVYVTANRRVVKLPVVKQVNKEHYTINHNGQSRLKVPNGSQPHIAPILYANQSIQVN